MFLRAISCKNLGNDNILCYLLKIYLFFFFWKYYTYKYDTVFEKKMAAYELNHTIIKNILDECQIKNMTITIEW